MHSYDLIVAGGSISGLLAAREASARGLSVLVIEEDMEIGTPEHCGGLVSLNGIKNLGIIPKNNILHRSVKKAEIFSPSGSSFTVNAEKQGVIAIDRRAFDKQVAHQATKCGADIWVKCSVKSFKEDSDHVNVGTTNGDIQCKIIIDARGCASIIEKNRNGVLLSAQYEVYADWIGENVEVYFDQKNYPSFFAWIIPTANNTAKVGVAGKTINTSKALQSFLDGKGEHVTVRKVFAPIWVLGPVEHFVTGCVVSVGDAAGQTKPTTAGGIYTCGMAGMFAGRAIANALENNNLHLLQEYEREWFRIFKNEFDRMLLARKVFEHLDNKAIDEMFKLITSETIDHVSESGDFDFHSQALSKLLSVESAIKIAKTVLGSEIRKLFS
ncbi:MAG: NAD(P)/FAD-dependent oxidoreductase [Nitrososphaerales archaeon]